MATQQAVPGQTATATAAEEQRPASKSISEDGTTMGFGSAASFALLQRGAMLLANSSLVPKEFQNNLPNCVIALNMAQRMGADPLMVMQNLYVVYGRPGWSSQFLIATFNQNGRFTSIRYEFFGEPGTDGYGCRAWAVEKTTDQKLVGADVTVGLAKREGWYDRKSKDGGAASKWPTMTQQMLMYRSAAWFIRAYAPEIAMGLKTIEEHFDIGPVMDEIIERTTERLQEERAAVLAAVDAAPSKLDALVDAEKAKSAAAEAGNGGETPAVSVPQKPAEKQPDKQADPAMTQAKANLKSKAAREGKKPTAATYADSEPDPFTTGELFDGREPGSEG